MSNRIRLKNLNKIVEKEKKPNYYLQDLEKHRDKSKEYKEYASKRFDILIITISTVGIGFISSQITEFEKDKTLPYLSIGLLGACLLFNLFGQLFSKKVNNLALNRADNLLWEERYGNFPEMLTEQQFVLVQSKLNKRITILDTVILWLDNISFGFLLIGIILFLVFIFLF